MTALAEAGLRLPHERPGKHRLPCPECDKGRCDDALQVTVTQQRWAFWKCWRCAWEGRAPLDDMPAQCEPQPRPRLVKPAPVPRVTPAGLSPWAQNLLGTCEPVTADTIAGIYLRTRGCAMPENDVLWHPALPHPSGHVGPALVAVVTDALTGERVNLHRTWLAADGSGKADIAKPRLLLKGHRKHGGVVRLFDDELVSTGLCVAEGIETALTAALGFTPVWACLDACNLAAFPVLPGVECLTIVADNDPPNPKTGRRAGIEAAWACAASWTKADAQVRVWVAPDEGQDLNDFVREDAA